jgi:AcrR family transcriptional regulator
LLRAAGEVFAGAGYQGATVRDICRRAGANVAAVNYHFGDKEQLYLAVLRQAQKETSQRLPFDRGLARGAGPAARLRAFVSSLLARLLEPGPHAWLAKLLSRELMEPTPGLDPLVQEHIRPMADRLQDILRAILGPSADDACIRLAGCSVVSQCLFYHQCRPVICRLYPDAGAGPEAIESLADHITRFSLAGLRSEARRLGRARSRTSS